MDNVRKYLPAGALVIFLLFASSATASAAHVVRYHLHGARTARFHSYDTAHRFDLKRGGLDSGD